MRTLLIIIITCFIFTGCGIKGDPEYNSQENFIKTIHLV